MNFPRWIPLVRRPWNPAYSEVWDAMSPNEKRASWLFDAVVVAVVLGACWWFSASPARGAEAPKKPAATVPLTVDCAKSTFGCSSLLTGTTTYAYSYTFGGGAGGVIATLDAKGKATLCGSPSTEAEVWEMWPRLEAASRLGLGEGFCSWYKARRAKP